MLKPLKRKIQIIDFMRGVSIFAVLALHLRDHCRPPMAVGLKDLWVAIVMKGYYGVSLFFVISGFLITKLMDEDLGGLHHPDAGKFYIRRIARILPLLVVIIGFGLFMNILLHNSADDSKIVFLGSHGPLNWIFWSSLFTFSFNWLLMTRQSGANGFGLHWDVLWSLSIEEQFYLLYPWVLIFCGRLKIALHKVLWGIVGMGILAQIGAYLIRADDLFLSYMNSFTGFEAIALGALLYLNSKKHANILSAKKYLCLLISFLGAVIMLWIYFRPFAHGDLIWGPTVLDAGSFLFLLGAIPLPLFNGRIFSVLAVPGRVSYGMYLWHGSVLFFLWAILSKMETWPGFFIYFTTTCALSYISFEFFELPMNHWVRKKLKKQNSGAV